MSSAFPRVLVVDDEPDIREMLEYGLESRGFEVRAVGDGRSAVQAMQSWAPEAIILDVMLPGVDGVSLISSLRRVTDVPILMVTGRTDPDNKISALQRGADDYIHKPFDLEELAAHLHARLRRPRLETRELVAYADITIDVGRRSVKRGGTPIELSTREFDLLLALARRPEHVFSRAQLLDIVWGTERDVTPATVETYISYLRAKIDIAGAPPVIQTIRGVGYTMRLSP